MAQLPAHLNPKIKIVIADDSLIIRERLLAMLAELAGVEVVDQVENGAEGIFRSIQKFQPDVVILDIHMPEGNGIEVLRSIKQDGVGPWVIILTNYPYLAYRQRCLQAGADFFLDKSAEFDQIPILLKRLKQDAEFNRKRR